MSDETTAPDAPPAQPAPAAPPSFSDLQGSETFNSLSATVRNAVVDRWKNDAISYGQANIPGFNADHAQTIADHVATVKRVTAPLPPSDGNPIEQTFESVGPYMDQADLNEKYMNGTLADKLGNTLLRDNPSATPFSDAADVIVGNKNPLMDASKPIVTLPEPTKSFTEKHPWVGGATKGTEEFVDSMTSPDNVKTIMQVGMLPGGIAKLVSLGFASQAAKQVATDAGTLSVETDPAKQAELGAKIVAGGIMTTLMLNHVSEKDNVTPEQQTAARADLEDMIKKRIANAPGQPKVSVGSVTVPPIQIAPETSTDLTPQESQKVASSPVPETEKAAILASKTSTAPASETEPLTSVGNKAADTEGAVVPPENKIVSTAIKAGDTVHTADEPLAAHNDITTQAAKSGVDVTDGERGFMDTSGNFVDRQTAAKTALDAGQIDQPTYDRVMARDEPGLQSEDLKPDASYVGGPGAMGPVEAQSMADAQKTLSIKNAQVDENRVARGLQPTMAPARQAMGKVWDDAMTKIESDPSYPSRMVDDILSDKKTKVSDEDHAALLHEQITLQNAKQQETERALDPNSSEGDRAEARIKYAALEDQLRRTEEAGRKIGTISGRALQIRQMMANDDYTLAAMEASRRVAKGDQPLTPEESVKIKQQSDRIADLEKQLSERQNTAKDRGSKEAGDEAVKNLKDEATRTPKKGRDIEADRLSTIDKLKSRVANGEKIQDMAGLVQKLALHFVEQGIKDREPLVNAVHEVLKTIVPDITPRETMDEISGYGEFKHLSKEETKVQLRDLKGQMQQAAKIEDMNNQIPPKKTGVERRIPSDIERRMIKQVNELKKKGGFNVTDPETQLKSALQAFKTRTENRISDLQEKLDTGDFSKTPRRELKLDDEAMKLKAESERVKLAFDRGSMAERLKTRTPLEKTLDAIPKWSRFALLSNPITLAKLTMAAIYRVGSSPLEEAIGAGLSKLIPDVADRAPKEGGGSIRVEAKALTDGLTKGFKDSYDVLTKGKSDLESAYGKRDVLPASPVVDFFGHLHGALKAPVKRIAFSRSMQKQMEFGMAHGVDVTDPFVQMKIANEAYKEANKAIFMQDSRVVSAYKAALATMERPDKATGKTSLVSKMTTATAKTLLPIVKIPTNIVAETFKYATGSVTGSIRLANAFKNGVENLKPEEADLIMRDLKKGSIGAAVLLLGYLNPQVIGGYYQKGQKQNPNDPKYGDVKLYGSEIPKSLLHAPLVEQLQLGATMRKAADSKLKSSDQETQGVPAGVMAGFLGLTSEVPFVGNLMEINKVFSSPQDRNKYFGELANSRLVPQAIQYIAKLTDKDAKGEPVKRDPQTVMQNVEAGIPGLRQNVPVKAGKISTPHMIHIRK